MVHSKVSFVSRIKFFIFHKILSMSERIHLYCSASTNRFIDISPSRMYFSCIPVFCTSRIRNFKFKFRSEVSGSREETECRKGDKILKLSNEKQI